MDHSMHQPVELTAPAQEAPEPQDLHAGHQMSPAEPVEQEREQPVDHSMHAPAEQAQPAPEAADAPVDPHAGHDMAPATPQAEPMDHAAMGHGTAMHQELPATAPPLDHIPPLQPGATPPAFPAVT